MLKQSEPVFFFIFFCFFLQVAVKFINRRKQVREETQKEFEILSILNHPNIVSSTGLFLTATSDAIVMKL